MAIIKTLYPPKKVDNPITLYMKEMAAKQIERAIKKHKEKLKKLS